MAATAVRCLTTDRPHLHTESYDPGLQDHRGGFGGSRQRPFYRSGGLLYHPSHNCPACGRLQRYASSGRAGVSPHTHTCNSCGTAWWH